MPKNVEIIIKADDKASAKFKQVQRSMESSSKAFKETGNKAKASTELVGTFATVLGNSGIGGFAGEMAQLTERFNAFSEVAEGSRAAAIAFRGALAAGVGIAAFKIGEAIGKWATGAERWNEELEEAIQLSERLNQTIAQRSGSRAQELLDAVREQGTLAGAQLQAQESLDRLTVERSGHERSVNDLLAERDKLQQNEAKRIPTLIGRLQNLVEQGIRNRANKERLEEINKQLVVERQILEATEGQRQQLQELLNGDGLRAQFAKQEADERARLQAIDEAKVSSSEAVLDSLQDQLALLQSEDQTLEKIIQNDAIRAEHLQEALRIQREIDAERAKQQKQDEEERRLERIADIQDRALDNIRQQVIALREGEAAARAFALQQQGLDANTARMIAAAEERLKAIRNESGGGGADFTASTAVESRLKTTAGRSNPMLMATEETASETKLSRKLLTQVRDVLTAIEQKGPVNVAVNSA